MKPVEIFEIMDLARRARANNDRFNPLFVGPPGVGKSEIVQSWAKKHNLELVDLRAAYLEAPDIIGLPSISVQNGRQVTTHNIPEFWPQDPEWEGVILFEEVNRGTTSVMNTFMQILTDGKVHKYTLPKKAILAACINPENSDNDVNTMDTALRDRFEIFDVKYDKLSFIEFMKQMAWQKEVIRFVEAGIWHFVEPESVKNAPGNKYISPRTLSKLNTALRAGVPNELQLTVFQTILGNNVGKDFYQFLYDESPVLYKELVENFKAAAAKLKKYSDPANFKNGMVSLTIQDIVEDGTITNELLADTLEVLPVDQGVNLVRDLGFKRKDDKFLNKLCKDFPKVKELFKETLNYGKI